MALTDLSRHCTIPAEAPQQSTSRPSRSRVGDSQHGVTGLIAAYGARNKGLASLQVRCDHDLPRPPLLILLPRRPGRAADANRPNG